MQCIAADASAPPTPPPHPVQLPRWGRALMAACAGLTCGCRPAALAATARPRRHGLQHSGTGGVCFDARSYIYIFGRRVATTSNAAAAAAAAYIRCCVCERRVRAARAGHASLLACMGVPDGGYGGGNGRRCATACAAAGWGVFFVLSLAVAAGPGRNQRPATRDPPTPSDLGRPAQPGSQRLAYIVWVINALSLVTSIKFVIGCLCTLLLPSDPMLCLTSTVCPLSVELEQCLHVLHQEADHQLHRFSALYLRP